MPNVESILLEIEKLPTIEQENILSILEEVLLFGSHVGRISQEVMESRFSKGKVCPHCGEDSISRNGKYNGKQRYICKSCRKSFTDFTNSAIYKSRSSLEKWYKYAKCMIAGYSIRKSAQIVGINIATSFFWRHKILDCLKAFNGIGHVDGVVEADEIFFAESFKGTKPSKMTRESRHRGSQVKKRGISHEQVCVATAIDRQGNLIMELLCKGRMTSNNLNKLYDGRIGENSIICIDSHKSYNKFARDLSLDHKRIPSGKHKEGIYHIQHINSIHSKLKRWMRTFNGVSTKYLSSYMCWFKWIELSGSDKDAIKIKNFIVQSCVPHAYTKISDFKTRLPAFI